MFVDCRIWYNRVCRNSVKSKLTAVDIGEYIFFDRINFKQTFVDSEKRSDFLAIEFNLKMLKNFDNRFQTFSASHKFSSLDFPLLDPFKTIIDKAKTFPG